MEEIYPEEVPLLYERIKRRHRDRLAEKLSEWEMLLSITLAPWAPNGAAVVSERIDEIRRSILGPSSREIQELELHRQFAELNKRLQKNEGAG